MTNKKIIAEVNDLYYELGITESKEIDLEAISFYKDAEVKKKSLKGCEARIIGGNDRAIITVNSDSSWQRQRFSIGHELGHWIKDRGKIGNLCSKSDVDESCSKFNSARENIANQFSSEFLMPHYLIKKELSSAPFAIDTVNAVINSFNSSFMAALRKIIDMNHYMGFWASYKKCGTINYFGKHDDLPYIFSPPKQAPEGTAIFDLIKYGKNSGPTVIDGDAWCRNDFDVGATVYEHAFHYHDNEFLTMVWWKDEEPIWQFLESIGEI